MRGNWEILVRRPMLWFLVVYTAGLVLSMYLSMEPAYLFLAMVAFVIAGLIYHKKALFPILLVILLLFGFLRGAMFHQRKNPLNSFMGQEMTLQGEIKGAPQVEKDRAIYILQTTAVKVEETIYPIKAKVKVSVYPDTYGEDSVIRTVYPTGDFLQATGTIKEPTGSRNPKGFDYKSYLARRNIYSILSVKESSVTPIIKGDSFSLDRILAVFRDRVAEVLERAVGGREGDFLKAVLLGQRWQIEPDVEDAFARTGLAHILAISGLHIGYLVMLLNLIQSLLRLRKGTTLIFQASILVLYCFLTGASPSVIRAVIMALIYLIGRALGRKTDMMNSAGTAALLILLIRPMDFLEVSFQLSFIAVCSIGLFHEMIQKVLRFFPKKVSSLLAVGLSAQLGTLPLVAYYFNLISPVSILANLVVLPILGIVTAGGFLLIPLGLASHVAAVIVAIPIRFFCSLILIITDFAAGLPFAYFRVVSPSIFTIIIVFLLLWMISWERPGFVRYPSLVCGSIIVVFLAGQLLIDLTTPKELKVIFLDVGQGDCCFIQTPDGKNILIDGGGQAGVDIGDSVLLPFLLKNGISSLDLVVMSHGHDDHISGLPVVMDQLKVKAFMEYPPQEENAIYLELKRIVGEKGIQGITATRGQSYCIGNETWIHILYPDQNVAQTLYQQNENNLSLVLFLEYEDATVLFTGDIEKGVEYYLTGRMDKQATILKVPHHGSNTSSTEVFLEAVSPKAAVIQSGTNFFGHPTPQTLERLAGKSIAIYRNDLQGAVMLSYKDNRWSIRTMLDGE